MPARDVYPYFEQALAPPAARTASGDSGPFWGYGPASTLRVQLNVTAASGTPTLDVVVEDTLDGGANWNTLVTFSQKTGTGHQVVDYSGPFADRIRARWTIGGTTPSFTFSVVCASQVPQVS